MSVVATSIPGSTATAAAGGPRRRLRLLVAVWGESHSRLFLDYGLPSLLAPGNLPLLAEHFACDFEFLTMSEDIPRFQASATVHALSRFAGVHYTTIDDLRFGKAYGTLLTYAFARGIAGRGAEMTETCFVFLNADFVFSDGSLRAMLRALEGGANAVVVPSFRCISEDFTARLRGADGDVAPVLSLAPRDLVRLGLDLVHPTFRAKTVNGGGPYTTLVNQFLWRVDDDTMLGRFYLLFMLCVRPEVPLDEVTGFCDYTFVPQLVPSGKVTVIADSDDAFLLELQHRAHEGGEHHVDEPPGRVFLSEQLSEWTTPLHRQNALHDLVFHAADLPPSLDDARAEAAHFIADVTSRLGPPCPYRGHPYWKSSFVALRADPDGIPLLPPDARPAEAPGVPTDEGAHLRRLAETGDLAGLLAWAERAEASLSDHRRALASLRGIRDRLRARIGVLHTQVVDLDGALERMLVARARLFDPVFYVRTNPDARAAGIDPEAHYRTIGWKRGSDPSPYFSASGYLEANFDVKAAGLEPWDHFCRHGWREGRSGWRKPFLEEVPPPPQPDEDPSPASTASAGWLPGLFRRPGKRAVSERDVVQGSGLFDAAYYLENNPDVAASGVDPLDHYLSHGAHEGRRPSRLFDGGGYLRDNPDVRAAGANPVVHWLQHGQFEGRPSPLSAARDET